MACRLSGAKPSSYSQCCYIVNWTLRNKLQLNINRDATVVIQENAFENVVCEMTAILFRSQCVKHAGHTRLYLYNTLQSYNMDDFTHVSQVHVIFNVTIINRRIASLHIKYRKVSNIRRTKCQNLNDSRLVLQLSVPNPLKPSVKSIMKM